MPRPRPSTPPRPRSKTRPVSPLSVRRTSSPTDALISPFLLDGSSISFSSAPSRSARIPATWLHLPVMLRFVPSRSHAVAAVRSMSHLRHPNVEQLLGAVAQGPVDACVLTEHVPGASVQEMISGPKKKKFVQRHAVTVALDVARALVYLHARTGRAHAGVSPDAVLFDAVRGRAVLLLAEEVSRDGVCAAPEVRKAGEGDVPFESDVYSLGMLVLQMFEVLGEKQGGGNRKRRVDLLPRRLQGIVWSCLQKDSRKRPSMEELCQAFTDCDEMKR